MIKETEDVVEFAAVLGEKILGNPQLIAAVKAKDWKTAGILSSALFLDNDVRTSAINAVDGIGKVTSEIKNIGVLDGIQLGQDALSIAKRLYAASQKAGING